MCPSLSLPLLVPVVFLQESELTCSYLCMLSLFGPSGIRAAWPQGRGAVCLDSRPQAGSFPHLPCPAVPRPLLFFLGFCPVCTVIGPREGCGLAGALHRVWAASRPGWPTPGPPVTAPSQAGSPPSCLAETGPGRAQWQASVMLLLPW